MKNPPLLVFADDWGRHPSSCQHLIRHLLDRFAVTWINTIGTRVPKLDLATLRRGFGKIRQWFQNGKTAVETLPANLRVINPKMWPWFTRPLDRRINHKLLRHALLSEIQAMSEPPIAITTLPIVADLMKELPVRAWVYYCVDDFSRWPGLDRKTMGRMESSVVQTADVVIAVSDNLQERLWTMGRASELLTHGVDVAFWSRDTVRSRGAGEQGRGGAGQQRRGAAEERGSKGENSTTVPKSIQASNIFSPLLPCSPSPLLPCSPAPLVPFSPAPLLLSSVPCPKPVVLFWGVIDRRMDTAFLRQLSNDLKEGAIVLVGPEQQPDPELRRLPRTIHLGSLAFADLPALAQQSAVLVMPYADLPVTRAMQPLKLKEYLATGLPVVVRDLPANREWADCLDLVDTPEAFSAMVRLRLRTGIPESQRAARNRLSAEGWAAKAARFEELVLSCPHRSAGRLVKHA